MDLTESGKIFEDLIIESLHLDSSNIRTHPQRLIQATKSLFGLNLKTPNLVLIEWSSRMISTYKKEIFNNFDSNSDMTIDIVSIHDLELSLNQGNRVDVIRMIELLKRVSNKRHILEFLLEVSLKQSGKSFLFIWSLMRNIIFVNQREIDIALLLAVDSILSDEFEPLTKNNINLLEEDWLNEYNLSIEFIDLSSHLLEAINTSLVRDYKIVPLINNLFSRKIKQQKKIVNKKHKINHSIEDIFRDGRIGVLHFINNQDIDTISKELILFLDSVRCLIKNLDKTKIRSVLYQFERNMHEFNV